MALKHLLATIAWMPEQFAPARENHIVRSTAVVDSVAYAPGEVAFSTFDAPPGTMTVLRLAFEPERVRAVPDADLLLRTDLDQNGYLVRPLAGGDCLVSVRHDAVRQIRVTGGKRDPATAASPGQQGFSLQGEWSAEHVTEADASMDIRHRQPGSPDGDGPGGGLADVYPRRYSLPASTTGTRPHRTGSLLSQRPSNEEHAEDRRPRQRNLTLRTKVSAGPVFSSAATGSPDFGEGGGPTDAQRMVFGYPGREDLKDSAGHPWRPGTEFVIRSGSMKDSVAESWWTTPAEQPILGTKDPDLYRYGVHGREFWVNVTVGPGTYGVRLKFAAARGLDPNENCVTIAINGSEVVHKMDVAAGRRTERAADLCL